MGPWLLYAALLNSAAIALFQGSPLVREFGVFVEHAKVTMLGLVPSIYKVRYGGWLGGRGVLRLCGWVVPGGRVEGSWGREQGACCGWMMGAGRCGCAARGALPQPAGSGVIGTGGAQVIARANPRSGASALAGGWCFQGLQARRAVPTRLPALLPGHPITNTRCSLSQVWRASGCMQGLDWSWLRCFSSTGEASAPDDTLWLSARGGYKPIIEYCGGGCVEGRQWVGWVLVLARREREPGLQAGVDVPCLKCCRA